ncbi:MAG: hypothetical protein NC343_04035 [Muribaculum sp.]|nr:hypothetical protein [Muribaculaceae bacterium]MCM1080899.1 hypothetical protein [Muribaculum sp.]
MKDLTKYVESSTVAVKVATHEYAGALMRLWVRRNWYWAFAMPIVAVVVAAVMLSLRYLLIGVVLACLVCPHIIVWVYYYHALSPRSRMSILPHEVTVTDEGITLTYVGDSDEEAEARKVDYVPASAIRRVSYTDTITIVHLNGGRYDVVVLPRRMPVSAASAQ